MSLFQRLAPVSARLMQNSFPATIPYNQTRGMANLKDLKTRMKSIASVKKITASMKTVATSKLKAAELRKEIALPLYSSSFQALEGHIESSAAKEGDKNLVIVVTSDRGLCGSVNSSVTRYIKAQAKQTKTASTDLIILGEKGRAGLIRDFYKDMSLFATELDKKPVNFADVLPIAEEILKKNFDVASIVSNKFISILTFETRERNFLSQERMLAQADLSEYELEPEDALEDLYSFHVATLLFSSIVENQACELGARMTSMDNATRNAGDMLNKITLEYNKRRQASITTELVEIISGAQSMQDAAAE